MKIRFFSLLILLLCVGLFIANAQNKRLTYCNPLNLDYGYTPFPNFAEWGKHRATADPTITLFKGKYYLFSTNQFGYWWSDDMLNWNFVYRKFLRPYNQVQGDELCAPATLVLGDTLLVIGSTYNKDFTLWMSTNPTHDDWKAAKDYFKVGAWDPGMFADDDGRVYIYHGSSNTLPLYGQEIDRKTFEPIGPKKELVKLDPEVHGWERFGEHNDNVFLLPFIEGAWMNKHNGKYYLQFGAPGTEQSGYGDGVFTGDNPLTAKFIAEKAGVDDFIAEAKPEDKMNYIKKEQQGGKLVAMMGDGTNDAPALAQADVGVAMNSGTQAAKEAGNMVDLDNDPTKLIEIVEIGKQLLMTRGTLTTFSIANDVAKYFAIVPALFMVSIPSLRALNVMALHSPESAILSAVIFNAIIIPLLIPLALKGVEYKPIGASALLRRNLLIYGLGGVLIPFIGIKLIDLAVGLFI